MIRINLASMGGVSMPGMDNLGLGGSNIMMAPEETRKEGLKRILIILIFPVALYVYEMKNLPDIRNQLSGKAAQLAELQAFNTKATASVAEIKNISENQAKIQARISELEKLSKDRQNEIRILDLFQQVIPEKLWFTRIESKDSHVLISGISMSDFDISGLMESLSRSVFFVDVNLLSTNEQIIDGMVFKKFEINCLTEKAKNE